MMWSSQLETIAWILAPPAILLLALNEAAFVYPSYVTRVLATLLVAASAITVIATITISNPYLAFMTGLLEGWMIIWSAVLLIHYNPSIEARRRRWYQTPKHNGDFEYGVQIWQRFPAHDRMARLNWSADLLISFRGVNWQFGKEDETKKPKDDVLDTKNYEAPCLRAAALRSIGSAWQVQAVHTVTWMCSSILFINSCHSAWATIGAVGQWAQPADLPLSFRMDHYNPSPWGPIGAVTEYGLAGLWGVTWHSYFKFGFQSASDMVIPRTSNPKLKAPLRLLRMVFSFLLSGAIHYCGSYMLPGPTQPSKEFLFFALQGVAVVSQVTVYDSLISKKLRRVLNPLLIAGWLYWTEPLIFGDQRDGGMWKL